MTPAGRPISYGTGALVGTNVVLTASHVCPWGTSPWMMQFIPAYYDGSSLLGSGVSSYVQAYRGYETDDQGNDMAVLKLYVPLGESLGCFGFRTYDDDWEDGDYWTKCGYASSITSERPNRVTWFPIIDDDEYTFGTGTELEYYADASGGDSGGPIFGWWSGEPYVIGTHSGWEEEYHFPFSIVDHNLAAGGSALSNLITGREVTGDGESPTPPPSRPASSHPARTASRPGRALPGGAVTGLLRGGPAPRAVQLGVHHAVPVDGRHDLGHGDEPWRVTWSTARTTSSTGPRLHHEFATMNGEASVTILKEAMRLHHDPHPWDDFGGTSPSAPAARRVLGRA